MFTLSSSGRAALASAAVVVVSAGAAPSAHAAVQFGQTVALEDIGAWSGAASLPLGSAFHAFAMVFAGSESVPTFPIPQTVAGKPFAPITVNFSGDTVFEYTISAPAGQRYRIDLPAGSSGAFAFKLEFEAEGASGVTLVPPTAVGLKLDGVAQPVTGSSSGVDPSGRKILIENSPTPEDSYTGSLAFSTLTVSLDYAYQNWGGGDPPPLVVDDVTRELFASADSYIAFAGGNLDVGAPAPTITLEPVPEPASLALLALGAAAIATRRR